MKRPSREELHGLHSREIAKLQATVATVQKLQPMDTADVLSCKTPQSLKARALNPKDPLINPDELGNLHARTQRSLRQRDQDSWDLFEVTGASRHGHEDGNSG